MADVLMLGVSGMRGIVGSTVTPEVAARFAGTVGTFVRGGYTPSKRFPRPRVTIARDGRAGGAMLLSAAASGLMASGCDVVSLDVAMTPTVGVVTDALDCAAGMVVTASHNPQQWNGLKVLLPDASRRRGRASAAAPAKNVADEIIAMYRASGPKWAGWADVGQQEDDTSTGTISRMHLDRVVRTLSDADPRLVRRIAKAKLRVVVDSVNSSGSTLASHLLKEFGVRSTNIADKGNGLFPHTPEPVESNLGMLSRAVKRAKADVGFAQDPDADRLALIDERGRFIGEEYTLVLAARALCELGVIRKGSVLAANLSTSRMIDDLARDRGLRVVRTAVGEANVVEAMKASRSPLGGEGNGGVIWPAITYVRDSLGTMGLTLALLALTGKPLSALVAEIPAYAIVKRKVDLARKEDAAPAVEAVSRRYRDERVDLQDGVRIDFESRSAWVHVRASNTEPIMRLIAEAPTRQQADGLLDEVAKVIDG
ncbi:MAG: phosphoglucosamine mutase [Phycisphaerales bacterium]